MTHAEQTEACFTEVGCGYVGTVSRAHHVSPNLYWLNLSVVDCGPRGEAVPVAQTAHHVFADPGHPVRPGFSTRDVAIRARDLRGCALV